jgi:hypothetical protein
MRMLGSRSRSRIGKTPSPSSPSSDVLVVCFLLSSLLLWSSSNLEFCPLLLVSCLSTISPSTTTRVWRQHHNAGGREGWGEKSSSSSSSSSLHVYFTGMDNYREADYMEQTLGAKRHDTMSILPDSMLETTLFVGNLCEFVSDQDLSELFTSSNTSVTFLQFVPAVVIRKPDLTSLQYGFVTFPSISEKEARIYCCLFGVEWKEILLLLFFSKHNTIFFFLFRHVIIIIFSLGGTRTISWVQMARETSQGGTNS